VCIHQRPQGGLVPLSLELGSEQPSEWRHMAQAVVTGGPPPAIARHAASRHDVVHVRMGAQSTGPGLQPAHHTDPAPNDPTIHRAGLYGLGGTPKQDGVARLLVAASQRPARVRPRPGDHAVGHRQPHTLLVFQPYVGLRSLTRGTVPVLAGVSAVMRRLPLLAVIERAAKRRGATLCNLLPGLQRTGPHAVTKLRPVRGAMQVQALSDLSPYRALMSRVMASAPSCAVLTLRWV
jgi:hypothetical protein